MKYSKIIFMFSFIFLFLTCISNNYSQTDNILLWNKLGSDIEAVNSKIGPNGSITGTMNYYWAQFGNGVQPSAGHSNSYISYDASLVDPDLGCIEFWYQNFAQPQGYNGPGHELYGMVNCPFESTKDHNIGITYAKVYGNTSYGATLRFNGTTYGNVNVNSQIPLGLHHIAVVWDRNGINGSADYIRLYLNSTLMATQTTVNTWGESSTSVIKVGLNDGTYNPPPSQCFAVDNLIIWDYAKTDFSDRFMEAPTAELAVEDLESTILALELPKGTENSLTKSLDNALKSLNKGNDGVAVNQLKAFINKVEAQRGKKLTEEEANELIELVEHVIDFIETGLAKGNYNSDQIVKQLFTPDQYQLKQNYPNPFNPNTQIKYQLPERGFVSVKIYNVMGQEINSLVNQIKEPGTYYLIFDGVQHSSGIYYCILTANDYRETIKMILLK